MTRMAVTMTTAIVEKFSATGRDGYGLSYEVTDAETIVVERIRGAHQVDRGVDPLLLPHFGAVRRGLARRRRRVAARRRRDQPPAGRTLSSSGPRAAGGPESCFVNPKDLEGADCPGGRGFRQVSCPGRRGLMSYPPITWGGVWVLGAEVRLPGPPTGGRTMPGATACWGRLQSRCDRR
jgi:hypothetical protein